MSWTCETCTKRNRLSDSECQGCEMLAPWWPTLAVQTLILGVMGGVFGTALAIALLELLDI